MTSPAEVTPDVADDDAEATGADGAPQPTPWSGRSGPHRSRSEERTATPGGPAAPDQNRPAAQGQPAPNPPAATPGATATPGPGTTAVGPQPAAPGSAATTAAPPNPAAPQGATTQLPQPPPAAAPPAEEPGPDLDALAELAPAALSAGAMAMTMLPMLASALSGLNGGGSNGQTGTGGSTGTGGAGTGGAAAGGNGQLSPEAQHAITVLKKLQSVYGEGDPLSPKTKELADEAGSRPTGTGSTAKAVKLRRLYQRTVSTAFNNLDNQLVRYMKSLAGNHSLDKAAVNKLLREVDVALAELGPAAYTKEGQMRVHQILTVAVQKAEKIVTGGQASSSATTAQINELTKQYIYNLAGQNYTPKSLSVSGGSPAAQRAIQEALAQVGDPYVWGAEGPNSFDCSGLMQYAARSAGVNIPRVAADQYRQLPKVRPQDIQPGDLIFPAAQYNGGNPGHVMMYIGNGKCVEAPSAGKNVQVTSLPGSYYASRWTG
ncbi:C40 family peptidase [Nocardia wallacei]|uniref:C40 family peptidase n=1 Tax=Nocardia wallacei TaxID=480035 RepID=UPI00245412B3|nr:NlpC/P60 family protein [Nocardia wallacei]